MTPILTRLIVLSWLAAFASRCWAASNIDNSTYRNLIHAVGLMKISYCIGGANSHSVLTPQSTSLSCQDCAAYKDLSLVKAWATTQQGNFNTVGYLAVNHQEKGIYLVFRGTKSVTDIITDITIGYTTWNDPKLTAQCTNCQVHMGFYRSFFQTWNEISTQLLTTIAQNPTYKIHIYGHSLGGATANLFAVQLKLLNISNERLLLITAGEPRTFNANFAKWFDSQFVHQGLWGSSRNVYRVTHLNDLVALIPNFLDYQPISGEIYIDYEDVNPPITSVYQCSGPTDASCSEQQQSRAFELMTHLADGHLKYFIPMNGCK